VTPFRRASIYVLAGANGAGKSSVAGAMILAAGTEYFNPDVATAQILSRNPGAAQIDANSAAWREGKRLLERAIDEHLNYAFETTLGGKTMTALLEKALSVGLEVRVLFVGLSSPELHVARVRARVARGGHDVPEAQIRARYDQSRNNLIRLLRYLTEIRVYDNSDEADLHSGVTPRPLLVLQMANRKVVHLCDVIAVPVWAKPIVAAALRISG
jgi:predicted ABC-type ATPase